MNRIDRITAILIQLQSRRVVKAQDIADRFGISLRTVYRDVRTLEEAGIPISGEAGVGYSILEGYNEKPPAGLDLGGKHYNPYFPGGLISMPFQLTPDRVTYDDGTKATSAQMAHDVVEFLAWAAEPKRDVRKTTGILAMIFLSILAFLTYASYKRIWRNVEH